MHNAITFHCFIFDKKLFVDCRNLSVYSVKLFLYAFEFDAHLRYDFLSLSLLLLRKALS